MDLAYLFLLVGLFGTAFGLVPLLGSLMENQPEERK